MLTDDLPHQMSRDANNQTKMFVPDYDTMIDFNTKIAVKDEQIEELKREILKNEASVKRELSAKEETISTLREQIKSKEEQITDKQVIIDNLNEYIADLKRQLLVYQTNEVIKDYPFKMGVADEGNHPSIKNKIP